MFELPAGIWADRVFVSGDFNYWSKSGIPMSLNRGGIWQATVDLPVGTRHEYRYLIDGEWRTDYHADGYTTNVHGTENSIVHAELPESSSPFDTGRATSQDRVAAAEVRRNLMRKWRARRSEFETAA